MTTTTTSHSRVKYGDWNKINIICDELADRREELLDLLGVEYSMGGHMIYGPCPVHGGDKFNAWNWYDSGRWVCRTHSCQNHFKGSSVGLLRGLLSNLRNDWSDPDDPKYGWDATIDFALSFLKKDYGKIEVNLEEVEKRQFAKQMALMGKSVVQPYSGLTREKIRKSLVIPAEYFLKRGYLPSTLDKHDVGYCTAPKKQMSWRVVVPIYDVDDNFVGCTGRSVFPQCSKCSLFHSPQYKCPIDAYRARYTKWKHSDNFSREDHVYNLNFAKDEIQKRKSIVLVESPGNVWRLEEAGINNAVACFGAAITGGQKTLLDGTGALSIIVLGDNDEAGRSLCEDVKTKCDRTYKLYFPKYTGANDIGDMTVEQIRAEIIPQITTIQQDM